MGFDDEVCEAADDGQHRWRITGVHLGEGADTEYVCTGCDTVLLVPAGQPLPGTV